MLALYCPLGQTVAGLAAVNVDAVAPAAVIDVDVGQSVVTVDDHAHTVDHRVDHGVAPLVQVVATQRVGLLHLKTTGHEVAAAPDQELAHRKELLATTLTTDNAAHSY